MLLLGDRPGERVFVTVIIKLFHQGLTENQVVTTFYGPDYLKVTGPGFKSDNQLWLIPL